MVDGKEEEKAIKSETQACDEELFSDDQDIPLEIVEYADTTNTNEKEVWTYPDMPLTKSNNCDNIITVFQDEHLTDEGQSTKLCKNSDFATEINVKIEEIDDGDVLQEEDYIDDFEIEQFEYIQPEIVIKEESMEYELDYDNAVTYYTQADSFEYPVPLQLEDGPIIYPSVHAVEEQCEHCNYKTKCKLLLKNHTNKRHPEFLALFSCPHCPYRSRKNDSNLLLKHIMDKHTAKTNYPCLHCDAVFPMKKQVNDHMLQIHPEIMPYSCTNCSYACHKRNTLMEHIKIVHKGEKRFSCPHCQYRTARKSDLNIHITGMHNKTKPFACPHCDYRSTRRGDLRTHVQGTHNSLKAFLCPHCSYRSSRKGDLQIHITGRHNQGKPFACDICPYTSSWKGDMQTHIKRHHGVNKAPQNQVTEQEMCHQQVMEGDTDGLVVLATCSVGELY